LIRATPDTNVLISGLFYDGNERAVLQAAIEGRVRLVLSLEIIDELITVLDKKFKADPELTRDYVLRLNELSDVVASRKLPGKLVRDREDAKIIECAHSGHSNYIVTGDLDLLSLKRCQKTRIISTSEFLRILRRERPRPHTSTNREPKSSSLRTYTRRVI
jgi:putative PIN family toxin of toxin-antitoxin system